MGWCPALTKVAMTSQQHVTERMETDPCALLVTGVAISLAGAEGDRAGRGDHDVLSSATLPTEPGPATDSLFRFDGLEQQTYLTETEAVSTSPSTRPEPTHIAAGYATQGWDRGGRRKRWRPAAVPLVGRGHSSPHPCRTYGVARPAERLDSTALSMKRGRSSRVEPGVRWPVGGAHLSIASWLGGAGRWEAPAGPVQARVVRRPERW